MRKPDPFMAEIVRDSYIFSRTEQLRDHGLSPDLIYFDESLSPKAIGKILKKLHSETIENDDDKYENQRKMKELSMLLEKSKPRMSLWFTRYWKYDISKPGFFSIPQNFKIPEMFEYIEENLAGHLSSTALYIEQFRVREKFEKRLFAILQLEKLAYPKKEFLKVE